MGKKGNYKWVYAPTAPKNTAFNKTKILSEVKAKLTELPKLLNKVTRVAMRSNRIYLYEDVAQFQPEGAVYVKPLKDGKYIEYPYARITIQDTECKICTADWQRHNNQWISLHTGTLAECLESIEKDNTWW